MDKFELVTIINNSRDQPQYLAPLGYIFEPTDFEIVRSLEAHIWKLNFGLSTFGVLEFSVVKVNDHEPWNLPEETNIGERESYFFCLQWLKYPSGKRINRATPSGFWKVTGNDGDVISPETSCLVGKKKTLVFYRGRAPHDEKTDWIMHEYRLDEKYAAALHFLKTEEWRVCKVFQKQSKGKDKIAVPMGASDPRSAMANGLPLLTEVKDTDDEDRCNNNRVSYIAEEHEDLENMNWSCPGEVESLLKISFDEEIVTDERFNNLMKSLELEPNNYDSGDSFFPTFIKGEMIDGWLE